MSGGDASNETDARPDWLTEVRLLADELWMMRTRGMAEGTTTWASMGAGAEQLRILANEVERLRAEAKRSAIMAARDIDLIGLLRTERDSLRVAASILQKLAAGLAAQECVDESGYCVFCDQRMVSKHGNHKDDCIWATAAAVTDGTGDTP